MLLSSQFQRRSQRSESLSGKTMVKLKIIVVFCCPAPMARLGGGSSDDDLEAGMSSWLLAKGKQPTNTLKSPSKERYRMSSVGSATQERRKTPWISVRDLAFPAS